MLKKLLRGLAIIIVIAIAIYGFFVIRAQPAPDHPFFDGGGVLVIAHQGGDGLRPSNTMAAFNHAMELGVDVLEMDIHSTSDGVLVTIHDDTVDRTTDGTGRVQDFTFDALQKLDAGYNWPTLAEEADRTDRPYRGQGITIPALEEVFQAYPEMRMNIEIKQHEPSIVEPFCALLRKYAMTDKVLVPSFHAETLYEFREKCPEVATSGVQAEIQPFFVLHMIGLSRAYAPPTHAFQVPEYSGGLHIVTSGFISSAHAHNIDVHAWTINDPEQMDRMIEAGVDGIITDYPDILLEKLNRRTE